MGYIKPDSALARAATDLLSRHAGQAGGPCPGCDQMSPCPSARHAIEVRRAAGLSDTISASDSLMSGGADPLGGGALGASSFGGGFGGNSGYSDVGAPALAGASQSGVTSGSFAASRAVGLSKVTADAD